MLLLLAQASGLEVQDASLCPESFIVEEDLQVCFKVASLQIISFIRVQSSPQTAGTDPGMSTWRSLWRRSSHTNVISFSSRALQSHVASASSAVKCRSAA